MLEFLGRINASSPGIFRTGGNWPGIFSAWCIYNLLNVLFIWEKARGLDAKACYAGLSGTLLKTEWGVSIPGTAGTAAPEPLAPSAGLGPGEKKLQDQLGKTVFLAYFVANVVYYLQHPRSIPGSFRGWVSFKVKRVVSRLKRIF
jgi:hypothetical protein